MTMQVPGSDQRNTDLRLVHDDDSKSGPEQALGLLENARRVADARSQVSSLEGSISGLRAQQDEATAKARELVEALTSALERHSPRG